MNHLFLPIFKNTIKMKSIWLYWCFGLVPFIVILSAIFNSDFLQIETDSGITMTGLDLFYMLFGILHNLLLPFVILAFIISKVFYDEIHSGIIFMYKDIKRSSILFSKLITLLIIHTIFNVILFISSTVVYYIHTGSLDNTSPLLLPEGTNLLAFSLEPIGIYLVQLIAIVLAITLSIKLSAGYTILGTLLFIFFTTLAPMLGVSKFLVPTGYTDQIDSLGLYGVFAIMIMITIIYLAALLTFAINRFKKVEY
ncbi:ABC-2 type transport system permease protein [Salsuginibacillus halophilus]|uniref:ABC-2 type transport system permease protein n=1 Tax=Salsuginibacillus halophilus TaxID=517424 RepID=A0A2P8HAM0_9BACI|nr:hypothetical protein [Salsuginibacillus halophilus]PSL43250.1 ABC-2 type transport system permease protein [Salsuginibacillus halophilus]